MKKQSPSTQLANLIGELNGSFVRWNTLHDEGGSDPFYSDGVNLNLVRNHILYDKRKISELCNDSGLPYPPCLSQPTPPLVDNGYMAKPNEIRANAMGTLSRFQADPGFQELARVAYSISSEKKQKALGLLNRLKELENAINGDDLVVMRSYNHKGYLIESVHDLIAQLKDRDYYGQQSFLGLL